jgi:RHS repeat-associated protein
VCAAYANKHARRTVTNNVMILRPNWVFYRESGHPFPDLLFVTRPPLAAALSRHPLATVRVLDPSRLPSPVSWALTDQQNTVRDLMVKSGSTTSVYTTEQFDAFGHFNIASTLYGRSTDSLAARFTGCFTDYDTSLQYNNVNGHGRWYVSSLGVWASQDYLGLAAGPNPGEYCDNSPTNYVDPSGLHPGGKSVGPRPRPQLPPGYGWWHNPDNGNWYVVPPGANPEGHSGLDTPSPGYRDNFKRDYLPFGRGAVGGIGRACTRGPTEMVRDALMATEIGGPEWTGPAALGGLVYGCFRGFISGFSECYNSDDPRTIAKQPIEGIIDPFPYPFHEEFEERIPYVWELPGEPLGE